MISILLKHREREACEWIDVPREVCSRTEDAHKLWPAGVPVAITLDGVELRGVVLMVAEDYR